MYDCILHRHLLGIDEIIKPITLVGGPNGEKMEILISEREREREMNLEIRSRNEEGGLEKGRERERQMNLEIRGRNEEGRLEKGRERERGMNLKIRSRNEDYVELNQQHLLNRRNNELLGDLERNRFKLEMRRIDFERQVSQPNNEEEIIRRNSNFQGQLRELKLQREIDTSDHGIQMQIMGQDYESLYLNNNIFSRLNNKKDIAKLNKFILNDENRKKDKDGNAEINTCCICLNDLKNNEEVVLLSCKHILHWNCGLNWFKIKNICPMCKYVIK